MQVEAAVRDGYDLRGFMYWTLIDNFEWNFAWLLKFGIYEWDENEDPSYRKFRKSAAVSCLLALPIMWVLQNSLRWCSGGC